MESGTCKEEGRQPSPLASLPSLCNGVIRVKSGTIGFKNKKAKRGKVTCPIGTHPDRIALGSASRSFDYQVLFFLLQQPKAMPADISHQMKSRERAPRFPVKCHFAQWRNNMMPGWRVALLLVSFFPLLQLYNKNCTTITCVEPLTLSADIILYKHQRKIIIQLRVHPLGDISQFVHYLRNMCPPHSSPSLFT